ncbi:hypothetical protein AB1Y20_009342 [Prymnesium parvum]|uniref:Constitutive coactivator of peroxisome proliferator-activated receptor gamma n=1 Tax=Prymnesium parvum TaxID=97485 RepID=A0AB34K4S8_PRYPA
MGVKGLHSFVEGALPAREHMLNLHEVRALRGESDTIVVDGMALIRRMYTRNLDWVSGGQYQELWHNVNDFVARFHAHSLRLVLFFDGGVDDAKLSEWAGRRLEDLKRCERVACSLMANEAAPEQAWMPPPNISKSVGGAFRDIGCEVFFTTGEADREMAQYCISHNCIAVLGHDSDFFVLPVPHYLVLGSLQLQASPPTVTCYNRQAVVSTLNLPCPLWPLFGSLVGNDFVQERYLEAWQAPLLPGRQKSGAPLIQAVAERVLSASNATGWSGPHPMTPILWSVLDFDGKLDAFARTLIQRSIEQYHIDADEGINRGRLPRKLQEQNVGRATSEMVNRFRSGLLDSAVFTAVTKQAIWRGPTVALAGRLPPILASRPIRAETYAVCLGDKIDEFAWEDRLCVEEDYTHAAADPEGDAVLHDSKASTTHIVREYLVYAGKQSISSPDLVHVPTSIARCEEVWRRPPLQRLSAFLAAAERAAGSQEIAAAFEARACSALGPITISLLSCRFMFEHKLIDRTAICLLLAQGLVMARLSAGRERLPYELRQPHSWPGLRGLWSPLPAVHCAMQYLLVSADLAVLNSAFGHPLTLAGTWEWFDGTLFMHMQDVVERQQAVAQRPDYVDWAEIFRGDQLLMELFHLLLPTVVPEGFQCGSLLAPRVIQAAQLWGDLHQSLLIPPGTA